MEKRDNPIEPDRAGDNKGVIHRIRRNPRALKALLLLAVAALAGGLLYWQILQSRVYIEKAEISAPIISLGPQTPGIIDRFYVREGESVRRNQVLAKVGDELIRAKTGGTVIALMNTPGQLVTGQDAVVRMVDTAEFRLVGRVEEDKGLSDIRVGQRVVFTVDAFGPREYYAVVDSIAATSRQSDIVFSISDKREEREFEVKAKYDPEDYPELRNGMSAKMWVYK